MKGARKNKPEILKTYFIISKKQGSTKNPVFYFLKLTKKFWRCLYDAAGQAVIEFIQEVFVIRWLAPVLSTHQSFPVLAVLVNSTQATHVPATALQKLWPVKPEAATAAA